MKENRGLFYPDGSFKNRFQIMASAPNIEPIFEDLLKEGEDRPLDWYNNVAIERQKEFRELQPDLHNTKITIPSDEPILFVPSSDWHLGSPGMDVELWSRDINYISGTKGAYAWLLGDMIDNYTWGEGIHSQLGNPTFQQKWGHKAIEQLRDTHSLLGGTPGDHDKFGERGGGMLSFYHKWNEFTNTPLMTGIGHLELTVGEIPYKISLAHRHAGNSIYSHAAAAKRLFRENPGADIVCVGHNHMKAVESDTINVFDGKQEKKMFLGTGTYKEEDGWLNKQGYGKGHLGSPSLILYPDKKMFLGFHSVEEGLTVLDNIRR